MNFLKISLLYFFLFVLTACTTVPVTGRKQLAFLPSSELLSLSNAQYDSFLKENKLSSDASKAAMVKRVGNNVKRAVELYMAQNNLSSRLSGFDWEFNLVENKAVNAWCMPGGKVVVYTGILPVAKDEAGLAVVLGHEIAHAIADHGNERMSQGLLQQLGGLTLSAALSNKPEKTRSLFMTAFGVGTEVGLMLPFSRQQESEADRIGLIFTALAGYDPREAPRLWERMEEVGGDAPPEFLSTHPAAETRIKNLNSWMPEALKYYKR